MIDLVLASEESDGPGFLRVLAVDLMSHAIWFLVELRQFEPILYLEIAIESLGASSKLCPRLADDDSSDEEERAILRSCAAENINDAILVLEAMGEARPIPHLMEAFAMLPGFCIAAKRSSYLNDILLGAIFRCTCQCRRTPLDDYQLGGWPVFKITAQFTQTLS